MGRIKDWLEERRWLANVRRVRRYRAKLTPFELRLFDATLRPSHKNRAMRYPDAFYVLTLADVVRAEICARLEETKDDQIS